MPHGERLLRNAAVADWYGMVLDILVQSRRDTQAAKRLLRKPMKRSKSTG